MHALALDARPSGVFDESKQPLYLLPVGTK